MRRTKFLSSELLKAAILAVNAKKSVESSGWVDDIQPEQDKKQQHYLSPEYKELHRPPLERSGLGLYGGEPGFEKSPRMWVDPDNPHTRTVWSTDKVFGNLRAANYHNFLETLDILNIDKLIRHARNVPAPEILFNDLCERRVPMSDDTCSAIIRYATERMNTVESAAAQSIYWRTEELFERMLITSAPPCDVGVKTHAEFIKCCGFAGRWKEGQWVVKRAVEESQSQRKLQLTSTFHDAVIFLCRACNKVDEGLAELLTLVRKGIRPQLSSLNNALRLCGTDARQEEGEDVWKMYDFYGLKRDQQSYRERMRVIAACGERTSHAPQQLLQSCFNTINDADSCGVTMDLRTFSWFLYALRHHAGHSKYVRGMVTELEARGLLTDYETWTYLMMFCAETGDGELAMELHHQRVGGKRCLATSEMVLLQVQSFARGYEKNHAYLQVTASLLGELDAGRNHSHLQSDIYVAFMALCARLGAIGHALGVMKQLLLSSSTGISPQILSYLILCNLNAAGSVSITTHRKYTQEILSIFTSVGSEGLRSPFIETVVWLSRCLQLHGTDDQVVDLVKASGVGEWIDMYQKALEMSDPTSAFAVKLQSLPHIPQLMTFAPNPEDLRPLRSNWFINTKDHALKRLGQALPALPTEELKDPTNLVLPKFPFQQTGFKYNRDHRDIIDWRRD